MFYLISVLIVALDQLTKWIILTNVMNPPSTLEVAPFFNIVLAMNKGISFSMFTSEADWAPYVLMGVGALISIGIAYWIWIEKVGSVRLALSFVLGGAVANIIDRIRFGAVVDFLDFHAMGYHWPAFNIADTMICLGVVIILIESLFSDGYRKEYVKEKKE